MADERIAGGSCASHLFPPWTDEQVQSLNAYQRAGFMHPFTCPNRSDGQHRNDGSDLGTLVAGTDGWWCRDCEYTQRWAHAFMADPRSSLPPSWLHANGDDRPQS